MMILNSPAKINLFFRVLRRRDDGYHEIASLMQAVSLYDELTIEHLPNLTSDILTCTDPSLPIDSRNLVLKATDLFRKKTQINAYFKIHLHKKIPHQAGLGGGSSNAATTLWGINQILGAPASLKNLQSWSAEIGSDIPFFFSTGTAYCTGRGETVENYSPSLQSTITVVKPDFGLPTQQVFSCCHPQPHLDPQHYLEQVLEEKQERVNDLEAAALLLAPELASLKKEMNLSLPQSIMTGSGSAFFGIGVLKHSLQFPAAVFNVLPVQRDLQEWY